MDKEQKDWRLMEFSHPERTVRLATCFSGIGAIEQAFRRLKLKRKRDYHEFERLREHLIFVLP